jgi:predicted DCC family thiol-disulfide oxidoreductase YuxK
MIRRNRGGKYAVHKKEREAGCDPLQHGQNGFGDFHLVDDDQQLFRESQGSLNASTHGGWTGWRWVKWVDWVVVGGLGGGWKK